MDHTNIPTCPFCPFSDADSQFVAQHIEFCHPELGVLPEDENSRPVDQPNGSSQANQSQTSDEDDSTEKYVDCPHGCGEIIADSELPTHLDLHVAEEIALEDSGAVQTEPQNSDADTLRFDDLLEDKYAFQRKGRPSQKGSFQRGVPKQNNRSHSPVSKSADFGGLPADGVRRLGVCFPCILRAIY